MEFLFDKSNNIINEANNDSNYSSNPASVPHFITIFYWSMRTISYNNYVLVPIQSLV